MSDAPSCLPDPSARLEAAFRAVYADRMQGLAFVNAAVGVEAVGFAPWKHYWLGVMLTPWSMNLLLAPRDTSAWRPLAPRRKAPLHVSRRRVRLHRRARGRDRRIPDLLAVLPAARIRRSRDGAANGAACARGALRFRECRSRRAAGRRFDALVRETAPPDAPAPLAQLEASLATPMSRRDLLHARFPGATMSLEGELVVRSHGMDIACRMRASRPRGRSPRAACSKARRPRRWPRSCRCCSASAAAPSALPPPGARRRRRTG